MILVYDERWNREPRPGFLRELKTQANTHLPVDSNCTLSGVESLTRQLDSQPTCDSEIIAFGGGGVLDKVKLAVLNQQSPIRPLCYARSTRNRNHPPPNRCQSHSDSYHPGDRIGSQQQSRARGQPREAPPSFIQPAQELHLPPPARSIRFPVQPASKPRDPRNPLP